MWCKTNTYIYLQTYILNILESRTRSYFPTTMCFFLLINLHHIVVASWELETHRLHSFSFLFPHLTDTFFYSFYLFIPLISTPISRL